MSDVLKDADYEQFRKNCLRYIAGRKRGVIATFDALMALRALDKLVKMRVTRTRKCGGFDDVESWQVLRDKMKRQVYGQGE